MTTDERKNRYAFDRADDEGAIPAMVEFLDEWRRRPRIAQWKRDAIARLDLKPGDVALDPACGTGEDVLALAEIVGPQGMTYGFDLSKDMTVEAGRRVSGRGEHIVIRAGDIAALPLPDESVDGIFAERILCHVGDPLSALVELRRVLKPGGRLVVEEDDDDLMAIDPGERVHSILRHRLIAEGRDLTIGKKMFGLLKQAGFRDVEAQPEFEVQTSFHPAWAYTEPPIFKDEAVSAGELTAAEIAEYENDLQAADADGRFFACLARFHCFARK